MTNYEWLVKEYPDLITDLIAGNADPTCVSGIALQLDGTPCLCHNLVCVNCRFHLDSSKEEIKNCSKVILNWLKKKHTDYIKVFDVNELKEAFYNFKEENNNPLNAFTFAEIEDFLDHIVIAGGKENDKS